MRKVAIVASVIILAITLSVGCALTGQGIIPISSSAVTDTPTATGTSSPQPIIDFNATALAATIQAEGGFVVTSTPLPVFPSSTPTPFNEASFLATINAQFAQATETAQALATPTPTPTNTPLPPRVLPPAGGGAPDIP